MKIIINADDCGYNPDVNKAIDYAFSKGAISSTTVLANSKYMADVKQMMKKYPNASFGIHLNLTEGPSLTRERILKERGIVDDNYCFIHGNSQRCISPDEELSRAIYKEWDAQFSHLKGEGLNISHVDGHHHCHSWPGLEHILVELMTKYEVFKARNRYHYPIISFSDKSRQWGLRCMMPLRNYIKPFRTLTTQYVYYQNYQNVLKGAKIKTPSYFGSYEKMISILNENMSISDTVELMCHPGLSEYSNEFNDVLNNTIGVDNKRIELVSFNEL